MSRLEQIKSGLFGLAVGDALGVPVEFVDRRIVRLNPVIEMRGYGTHHQPAGTWSDDSSMAFCTAEALTKGYDLQAMANNFLLWANKNYWTPHGHVFDMGMTVSRALKFIEGGTTPVLCGGMDNDSNGNGSLMRILPLVFYLQDKPINERFQMVKDVSSITHAHIISVMCCFYYTEFALQLIQKKDKFEIYRNLKATLPNFFTELGIKPEHISKLKNLLQNDIFEFTDLDISSGGYVLYTLEASVWSVLTTETYKHAVCRAVNLGDDTDTTGAVTGGLAGLLYGFDNIPKEWVEVLARVEDIEDLCKRMV